MADELKETTTTKTPGSEQHPSANPMLVVMTTSTDGLADQVPPTGDDVSAMFENQYVPIDSNGDAATVSGEPPAQNTTTDNSAKTDAPMSTEMKAVVAEGFITGLNDLVAFGTGSLNKYMNQASLNKAKALKAKLFAKLSQLDDAEKALLFYCDQFVEECQKQIDSFAKEKALSELQIKTAVTMAVKIMDENNINPNPWWGLVGVLVVPIALSFWKAASSIKTFDPASYILQYEQLLLKQKAGLQKSAAQTPQKK